MKKLSMQLLMLPVFVAGAHMLAMEREHQLSTKIQDEVARARRQIGEREREVAAGKEVIFTTHAKQRMEKRNISRGEVEKALEYGKRVVKNANVKDKHSKVIIFTRKDLVVITDPCKKTVITVYKGNSIEKTNEKKGLSKETRYLWGNE